jgi:hypothetical protein
MEELSKYFRKNTGQKSSTFHLLQVELDLPSITQARRVIKKLIINVDFSSANLIHDSKS